MEEEAILAAAVHYIVSLRGQLEARRGRGQGVDRGQEGPCRGRGQGAKS